MKNNQTESVEKILPRIFKTSKYHSKMALPSKIQQLYWQHFLEEHWEDICGSNLAKLCYIQKLDGNKLFVNTNNSLMANELYMLKKQFLQKINILLEGMWKIKEICFYTSGSPREAKKIISASTPKIPKKIHYCSRCGAEMTFAGDVCCVCSRELQEAEAQKIKELLLVQPWLDYKNCLNYLKCDKILFMAIKDSLKNYYFEAVRNDKADAKQKIMAAMLLTGKSIEDLDDNTYKNALEFLRRKPNVSTRRLR